MWELVRIEFFVFSVVVAFGARDSKSRNAGLGIKFSFGGNTGDNNLKMYGDFIFVYVNSLNYVVMFVCE